MFALLLLLAAATSKPAVPPRIASAKALGACSAVTSADLDRALGRRFGPGQEETRGAESTCDYGVGNGKVSITILRLHARLNVPAEIEGLQKTIEDSSVRLMTGLGTSAFYLDIAGIGTQLHVVREPGDYVMVSILGFGEASQVSAAAERLARAALGRI